MQTWTPRGISLSMGVSPNLDTEQLDQLIPNSSSLTLLIRVDSVFFLLPRSLLVTFTLSLSLSLSLGYYFRALDFEGERNTLG